MTRKRLVPYKGFRQFQKLSKGVYWIQFQEQAELCSTFLRPQEAYEGPAHKNKIFTFEDYVKAEIKKNGCFTYLNDWFGFNVPYEYLKPFLEGKFDPLDDRERMLCLLLKRIEDRPYYLIGTCKEDESEMETLNHELAHAFYSVHLEYKREVKRILKGVDLKPIFKVLKRIGYDNDRELLIDEAQAYLMDNPAWVETYGIPVKKYKKQRELLLKNFRKYRKNVKVTL